MDESKTFVVADTTITFTKDESIPDGMVLVNYDEQIVLMTIVDLDKLFDNLPFLEVKRIICKMNSFSESKFEPMHVERIKKAKKLLAEYELEIETKRAKVAEVTASISATMKQMNDSMPGILGFNLQMISEIEQEMRKLKTLKKFDEEKEQFVQKFNDLNRQTLAEQEKSWTSHDLCHLSIRNKIIAALKDNLYYNESMEADFKAILLSDEYTAELEAKINKNMSETTSNFSEIFDNLKLLAALINKMSKSSVVSAEKRARARAASAASVSSVESDGATESAHPKGSLLVQTTRSALPPVPRHPGLKLLEKKSRHAEAEVVVLDIEPETAKDALRFVVAHNPILKTRIEEARLGLIQTRLEMLAGVRKVVLVAASPEIDAALKQVIFFRDEVVHQPYVAEAKSIWEDLDTASKLLTTVSQKVRSCGGGGGGCPEEDLAAHAKRVLEERRVQWIEAEAAVLGTLFARMAADHEMEEAAARVGWVAQKFKVANYGEFIKHIRRQAVAVGLIVDNGIPKDPFRDPRPAIYIRTVAGNPLHLTLSPDVLSAGKFHMTHNNLPEASKRFYFSIRYDPGYDRPYIVADGTSERIEISQIAQRFIDELTRAGKSTDQIKEEVGCLLEFLMVNMDTQSTKRRGGYYEKYIKYKAKYLALKFSSAEL